MAEQTFKSPGFFEREIEVIKKPIVKNTATPVGVIGTAIRGPAFVPTTVYSQDEFTRIFGMPQRKMIAGHAPAEFFRNNGQALTFCRTLGAGSWTGTEIDKAGFKLVSKDGVDGGYGESNKKYGAVHFVAAQHTVSNAEFLGLGIFNDNDSHATNADNTNPLAAAMTEGTVELVRAMIFTHKDYSVFISPTAGDLDITADVAAAASSSVKLVIKHAIDVTKDVTYTVSLDPSASDYISNVLNTDPLSFDQKGHLLYAHFPVDTAVAEVETGNVAILHGDDTYAPKYGDFSNKYTAPETPKFISQPFGQKEYDLFHFESLDDGAYASDKYKISISNLKASTDPTYEFGSFTVAVRDLRDTDESPIIYETFSNCSLDPNAASFIGRVIGDQKIYYSYETSNEDERRLVREGSFANVSTKIRVIMSDDVLNGEAPQTALPFGYHGVPALLLNSLGTDATNSTTFTEDVRGASESGLDHAVLPPLPYRFKVTKGSIKDGASYSQTFTGDPSDSESVDLNLHWGLMSTRVSDIDSANSGTVFNEILSNYTKFLGKDDAVVSSALADSHNNNKFSLAKVTLNETSLATVSGTLGDVFKKAVYIRNADVNSDIYDASAHMIKMTNSDDPLTNDSSDKVSLAKLLAEDPIKFNKYNLAAKFTAPFHGGFDGLNILDSDSYYMTDLGVSAEKEKGISSLSGKASVKGFESGLRKTVVDTGDPTEAQAAADLMQGSESTNNLISSLHNAVRIMTDELVVNHNVLVLPNVRDSFTSDFVKVRIESYGKALYLMDIPFYDKDGNRLYVNEKGISDGRPDVDLTSSKFDTREINSSYVASYFPDVMVQDSSDSDEGAVNSRRSIKVPSSIVALGALAKTDAISSPWFAPAGFSRGSLDTVVSTDVRLNAEDRDTLYEARINPIANFPNKQFVIFGQKTSQLARTALDRVNVRRLVLEIKRQIGLIAQVLLFAQNNKATRDNFISRASSSLATIQLDQGIEDFRVVMDSTNNSDEDVDNNRLNGKIIIVPTRAVEFIAIDFVITNAGVEFP
jgi:hypothetical protein